MKPIVKVLFILAVAMMVVYTYMCSIRMFIPVVPMAAIKASPIVFTAIIAWTVGKRTSFAWKVAVGLLLSALGDVFLEFDDNILVANNELYFIGGLASFLVAHLFYVAAFASTIVKPHYLRAVPFAFFAVVLLSILLPSVKKDLLIPVVVYGTVIAAMGVTTALRIGGNCSSRSGYLALLGALSFMASDSTLAVNKFHTAIPNAKVIVIITYYLGQMLIGLSAHNGIVADVKHKAA